MSDSILQTLSAEFAAALAQVSGQPQAGFDPQIRASSDAKFGDYQCNAAMSLAKALARKPRELAEAIVSAVAPRLANVAEPLEIAGPGFINIRLTSSFLARYLEQIPAAGDDSTRSSIGTPDAWREAPLVARGAVTSETRAAPQDRVGIPLVSAPQTVVVDYSSPNIAKQMHVGHLRSTIIGDVFARVLSFEGQHVIRQNHVGDWGTGIGMVILGLWYVQSRRLRHAERDDVIARRIAWLSELKPQPAAERSAALQPLLDEWVAALRDERLNDFERYDLSLDSLELGYRFVQALVGVATGCGGAVEDLAAIPRRVTADLQRGDAHSAFERAGWRKAREISLAYCQSIYERLGALLTLADFCGESFYSIGPVDAATPRDRLGPTLSELCARLAPRSKSEPAAGEYAELREDQGALCLFLYDAQHAPRFRRPDGGELPMIVRKSDGAYLYASTDLAAARYRILELGAKRIIYVVGAPQAQHLQMLFAAVRAVGWAAGVELQHTPFGMVLGADGKMMKTRSGENIKLAELLDEAQRRALDLMEQREAALDADARSVAISLDPEERREIARRIGIAAIKYADLARDRTSDYVFNWDKMLALQGNTAPYMLYAYARIRSIYRKAAERFGQPDVYAPQVRIELVHASERALALRLCRFRDTIAAVSSELLPHILCSYLFELASDFMRFYEACPVLAAESEPMRASRMRLCDLTARSLRLGLYLLGIEAIERM